MLGAIVAAASVAVVVTCGGAAPPSSSPAASSAPWGSLAPSRSAAATPPPASAAPVARASAPSAAAETGAPRSDALHLPALGKRLAALASGERSPVRILWLGDSHTQADFWVDPVRRRLQARFGDGGPGFVHVGLDTYRHSGFDWTLEGLWRREPSQPSHIRVQDDGVFGLGGMRTVAKAGARARLTLRRPPAGEVRWTLTHRLRPGDVLEVAWSAGARETLEGARDGGAGLASFGLVAPGSAAVVVTARAGEPQIFGAVAETVEPGVVVDTCGINGARAGTPLAWAEDPWVALVADRAPALVVVAYGTNEIGDATDLAKYPPRWEALITRVRRAAPAADCLFVGPTDLGRPDWTSHPRGPEIDRLQRETAARLGCAHFSVIELMGGDGGIRRWYTASPPLAHGDRVHLTPKGYAKVGEAIADRLLAGLGGGVTSGAPATR